MNSLFECHILNTIKYTNIQQNKTYLIPSPFGLDYTIVYYKADHSSNNMYIKEAFVYALYHHTF